MSNSEKTRLLRIRDQKKQQRPSFVRNESWRYKKLAKSGWRKQRGIDNKTRRKTKNGIKSPEPGYRGPKAVRDLHPSGLEDKLVMHISDLENLNPETHGIRIAKRLGARKRIALVEEARERGFNVLNIGLSKEDLLELEEEVEEVEEETEEKSYSRKEQIKHIKEEQSHKALEEPEEESDESVDEDSDSTEEQE